MEKYIIILGSIILIYISIINLISFSFKMKEIVLIIVLIEVSSSFLIDLSEFLIIFPTIIISNIYIYIKSKNICESILIPIISVLIAVIIDYLISNIYILIFGGSTSIIRSNIKLYWGFMSISYVLVYLVSRFIGFIFNKKIKIHKLKVRGKVSLLIIISLILTLIIFYVNIIFESSNILENEIIKINGILFIIYFALLMVVMYILFKSVTKELEIKNKQMQFESLKEYTNNLEKLYSNIRVFKHDYINMLSSMIGYIQNKDIDGIEKIFNEKILPLSKEMDCDNFKLGTLKNIRIPEIKGIFSSKLIRAQELGIDVFVDIIEPIESLNMDIIDISKSIGILLDNAIEAVEKCNKSFLKVGIINKSTSVLIVIINNYSGKVHISKIYEKGFSTKDNNRGLGLSILREIIGKYNNVSLDTLLENGEFKQLLEINNDIS
ncbi:sensor histidine kinase [Clostridium sp. Marseille-Q7071]